MEVKHHDADLGHLAPSIMARGDRNDVAQSMLDNLHINHRVYKADVTPNGGCIDHCNTVTHRDLVVYVTTQKCEFLFCRECEDAFCQKKKCRTNTNDATEMMIRIVKNNGRLCFLYRPACFFHEIDSFTATGGLLLSSSVALSLKD